MALSSTEMNFISSSQWHELPPIINEVLIHRFIYWNHHLRVGMRYGNELYMLFQSYPSDQRLKASDVACQYMKKGIQVCITASKTTYSVWLNLRSLSAASTDLIDQEILYTDCHNS